MGTKKPVTNEKYHSIFIHGNEFIRKKRYSTINEGELIGWEMKNIIVSSRQQRAGVFFFGSSNL